tara:strand:+ start:449 stop:1843 length:1395 start_codon:yes stop_codon:yes gene_type:complete
MKKNFIQDLSYLNFTIIATFTWLIIFGPNLSLEPYVWDDLHFFRKYTNEELLNTWSGNWDPDNIETQSYRPIAVLYYHITYVFFNENTLLFRIFVFFEILILVILTNQLYQLLNLSKNQIIIFTSLLIFSKIFITLVAWFTISVLIFVYILAILSIKFYLLSIDERNNFYLFLSLLFAGLSIFAREELYVLPIILFLIYFFKYNLNKKNIFNCIKKTFLFFVLVFLHIFLRKKFIPEADHLQIIDNKIYFGESLIGFGGFIKAVKSSFLPMGYLSSSYSDDIQKIFSIFWIFLILISILIIFKFLNLDKNKLKKISILFLLVFASAVPHLTIPRSFGIYLPSIFGLMLISLLINNLLFNINEFGKKINFFCKILSILILITGISGGIYRSYMHTQSMNKFSKAIVDYDARMIYDYDSVSIPIERYNKKKDHLEDLNVYDYNWQKIYYEFLSPKINEYRYHPLSF